MNSEISARYNLIRKLTSRSIAKRRSHPEIGTPVYRYSKVHQCQPVVLNVRDFKTMTKRSDSIKFKSRRSSLDVILLGMLFEEPMYAYRMQKLIKQRGMDAVVNVRHLASVYQTLERLLRLGLIDIQDTAQAERSKDRVDYAITDRGREITVAWLPKMVTTVGAGVPDFPAAVSVLTLLSPDVARKHFELRADALRSELSKLDAEKLEASEPPQLFLLEYRTALLAAEHSWILTVIADLSSGSRAWGGQRHVNVAVRPAQGCTVDRKESASSSIRPT